MAGAAPALLQIAGGFRAIGLSLLALAADVRAASDSVVSSVAAMKAASVPPSMQATLSPWNPGATATAPASAPSDGWKALAAQIDVTTATGGQ